MTSTADVAQQTSERDNPWQAVRRRVLLVGLAALLLAILPLVAAHHLPLLDAPGHESRLAVLRDLLTPGRGSDYYDLSTFFLPNVAFDIVGLGLVHLVEPETAGKIFFALTLALTLSGVAGLSRVAIGRWSLTPIFAALLLYNLVTILGFFSYSMGLALVPWALAGRILAEREPAWRRMLAGAAFGTVLLFCHVFDFAIYGVMFAGFTLSGLVARRLTLAGAALRAVEGLPPLVLLLFMSTGGTANYNYEPHLLRAKLFGIVKAVTSASMTGDAAFVAGALLFALLVLLCTRMRLAQGFLPGLAALVVIYFIMPDKLASGSYVDKRMPVAVALLLLAGLDLRVRRPATATVLVVLIGAALLVKQAAIAVLWRSFDPLIDKLTDALERTPSGSIIMQAECQPNSTNVEGVYRERQPSLAHVAAMAAFEDSRFVANTWAISSQQPVQVQSGLMPYYNQNILFGSSTCDVAGYRKELAEIQNLAWAQRQVGNIVPPIYFLLIRPPAPNALADEARLAASDPSFELYEVRPPR